MELVVSKDPGTRRLAAGQLTVLADSPYLTHDDLRRIRAASAAALATPPEPWDTEHQVRPEEDTP